MTAEALRSESRNLDFLRPFLSLADELTLLGQLNMSRFRQWAADARSPVDFKIEREEGSVPIRGYKEFNGLPMPEELRMPYLPTIDLPTRRNQPCGTDASDHDNPDRSGE